MFTMTEIKHFSLFEWGKTEEVGQTGESGEKKNRKIWQNEY